MSRTRRTSFAAPFVMTVLLAPACGGKAPPPTTPTPGSGSGSAVEEDAGATRTAPPGGTWARDDNGTWIYGYGNGDQVVYGVDGQCRFVQSDNCGGSSGDKPVVIDCNPPPPQDVACPAGLPADAAPAK